MEEYEFESSLSLDYPSYWDEEIKFLSFDFEKKLYVYSVFKDEMITSYELLFGYDVQVFKVDANSYGFIVLDEQKQIKTVYLFEMEEDS